MQRVKTKANDSKDIREGIELFEEKVNNDGTEYALEAMIVVDCKVENVLKWKFKKAMSAVDSKNAAVQEKTSYDISMFNHIEKDFVLGRGTMRLHKKFIKNTKKNENDGSVVELLMMWGNMVKSKKLKKDVASDRRRRRGRGR